MKVNFYATLRPLVGQKTVEIELPEGATVQQLIDALVARYPSLRPELVDEEGRLHGHVHVFVKGRDVYYLEQDVETPISSADKIDIFPAVGGG